MTFDWNLDRQADEDSTQDYLGFEPFGLTQDPAAPVEPAVPRTSTAAATSRRELRMAALQKQPRQKRARRKDRTRDLSVPQAPSPWDVAPQLSSAPQQSSAPLAISAPTRPANRRGPAKPKKPFSRRALPKVLSFGAMVGAAGLLVATSLPANAFMPPAADAATVATAPVAVQKLAPVTATAATAVTSIGARDKYTVVSLSQQMALKFMNADWSYTNDPNGTIQWPFPVQVPIATGFGPRHVAGCSFCSTFHEGVDFDPGQGVAIGSITAGVVSQVVESHSGLGNHVVVDHVVKGVKVQSVYGHMLDGSIRVVVGQAVTVTQELGQVGSTGESTGAHLHLEIHVNDVPIDPFAWLKANAN
jgi:murein DD-endopeptidase MepM/ murein hydrolase activator NlpD